MPDTKMTPGQIKEALAQFYGTENYYRGFLGLIWTDGTKAMADMCGAGWLLDAIASHQPKAKEECDGLQFWKFERNANGGGVLTCRKDSDIPPCITQEVKFTDFPLDSIDIWVGESSLDGEKMVQIAYLPSEH